jgi:hypothetical protein
VFIGFAPSIEFLPALPFASILKSFVSIPLVQAGGYRKGLEYFRYRAAKLGGRALLRPELLR